MNRHRNAAGIVTRWLAIFLLALAVPNGLASIASAQQRAPDTIAAIDVQGTERVDRATVISYLTVQVGDPFDPREINTSLKKLFATEIYTRAKVQADVQRIADVYRRSGRFGAKIEPKLIRLDQNRVDVVFEIDEGEITSVDRIVFIGNKRFSDSRLRGEINTTETAWWRFYTNADVYDPDRITFDEEQLRRFYLKEGYADFRVISAVAELTPERTGFIITFNLEEGERYRVGKVDIESQLPEVPAESLLQALSVEPGDWYDASVVETDIDALTDQVAERGFAFVTVRPSVRRDRENLLVNLTYAVGEGPRVYVNRIDIQGNVRTKDRVIRREFRLAEGDAYSASKIRRSRTRIQNLGFFETVEVKNKPTDQPDRVDIGVEVAEKSTGEISFGAGFSTSTGILGDIGIRERNLLGKGQDLRLRLQISTLRQQIDLGFTEPYFLDRDLAVGFDVFQVVDNITRQSSFRRNTTGGRLRAGYSFTENFRQSWSYTLRTDDIRPRSNASRFIQAASGKSTTSAIAHTLSFDNRDNRFTPNSGYVVSTTNELAGLGGSTRYLRNRLNGGVYYSVVPDVVVSALGQVGHIISLGKDVTVNERFNLGGDSFRGFELSGIGPRDLVTGDALGGNFFTVGTLEASFPVGLPDEFGLKGRVFAEAGTLFGLDESGLVGVGNSNSLRATVGVGASWNSPFGPIRVDFALPVLKEDYDRTQYFHFSFGTRF